MNFQFHNSFFADLLNFFITVKKWCGRNHKILYLYIIIEKKIDKAQINAMKYFECLTEEKIGFCSICFSYFDFAF